MEGQRHLTTAELKFYYNNNKMLKPTFLPLERKYESTHNLFSYL